MVNLRSVNRFTVKNQFPVPIFNQELHRSSGSKCFARLDLSNSHWHLPFEKSSQECQSLITPIVTISAKRVLHGATNAVMFQQSAIAA